MVGVSIKVTSECLIKEYKIKSYLLSFFEFQNKFQVYT